MSRMGNVLTLFLTLFLILFPLISIGSGASDVLLNGTNIYVATGESYGLYQGYVLSLKSVSVEGSIWLQLTRNDKIIKSEIVDNYGYFTYIKNNKTIISAKVNNVYSGSSEQNLVSLLIDQSIDPDLPAPNQTVITPADNHDPGTNSSTVKIRTPGESLVWTLGIVFLLILFYVLRKLW